MDSITPLQAALENYPERPEPKVVQAAAAKLKECDPPPIFLDSDVIYPIGGVVLLASVIGGTWAVRSLFLDRKVELLTWNQKTARMLTAAITPTTGLVSSIYLYLAYACSPHRELAQIEERILGAGYGWDNLMPHQRDAVKGELLLTFVRADLEHPEEFVKLYPKSLVAALPDDIKEALA